MNKRGESVSQQPSTEPVCKCGHTKSRHQFKNSVNDGFCIECRCNDYKPAADAAQTEPGPRHPDDIALDALAKRANAASQPPERTGRLTVEQFWLEWIRGKGKRLAEKSLSEINCEFATAFRDASEVQELANHAGCGHAAELSTVKAELAALRKALEEAEEDLSADDRDMSTIQSEAGACDATRESIVKRIRELHQREPAEGER